MTVTVLESAGCLVDTARTGQEVLEATSRVCCDVILMHCQMPVLDGYEATKAIRERERAVQSAAVEGHRRVPIIAVTANALESARQQCLAAGMDDWLVKPIGEDHLLNVVERWLSCRSADSGLPSSPQEPGHRLQGDERYVAFSDLASKAVHDLRTLLIGINRTLLLSKQGAGRSGEQEDGGLAELATAAELVLGTIDDRFDVYQGRYGSLCLQYGSVSLAHAVSEAIVLLAGDARDKDLRMTVEGADGVPTVSGDKRRLQRVFVNLLDHAIKYSAHGGTIRVRFEDADEDGSCVVCVVEHDGQEVLPERIADPLQSAFGAVKNVAERRQGIGLDFCRVVIEAHGGTIWVETREGRGPVSGFRLPIVRVMDGD